MSLTWEGGGGGGGGGWGSGTFPVGVVLCYWAVEHNMAMFSELFLAVTLVGEG